MESLLYFLLWGGLIFLMMRLGCGAHVTGHGQRHDASPDIADNTADLRWIPPAKDIDPVCGKTVGTDKAKPSIHDGRVFYFCSRECREVFEAAPGLYLGDGNAGRPKMEETHA